MEKSINLVIGCDINLYDLKNEIGGNIANNMLVYKEDGITYLIRPNGELMCIGYKDILPCATKMKQRIKEVMRKV